MIIQAVDAKQDLFVVENLLPDHIIDEIEKQDLWQCSWEAQEGQDLWARRKLLPSTESPLAQIDIYYNQFLTKIEETVGIVFENKICWSSFWLDYENYHCLIHEDGAERGYTPLMAMQVYLTESDSNLGTVWYNDAIGKTTRYAFPYKKNTGYLMLNRQGQWHGMLTKIPAGELRLSSYTYFGKFKHK